MVCRTVPFLVTLNNPVSKVMLLFVAEYLING